MTQMIDHALNLLQAGEPERAVLTCEAVAHNAGRHPETLAGCATVAFRCGRYDLALQWLRAAIRFDDARSEYHLMSGRVLLHLNRVEEAIAGFEGVLRRETNHALAHFFLGQSYLKTGAYSLAANHFQQSIRANPNRARFYYWLGVTFLKQRLEIKAAGCFKKVLALKPGDPDAHYQLGLIHLKKGRLARSRDCFYRVVSDNGDNWRAWVNLCTVLRDLGEFNEAMHAGKRAVSLNPASYHAWHNLANVQKDMGRYTESIACYREACSLKPESDTTLVGMGIAYLHNGDMELAADRFKAALKLNPHEGTAITNLLHLCMLDCDWESASRCEIILDNLTADALKRGAVPAETPFLNLSRCDDAEVNLAVAGAWNHAIDQRMAETRDSLRFQYSAMNSDRIRIAYLSNNFGDHPTAHITSKLYGLHDRKRFEVLCFSYGSDDNSRYRQAIVEGCDQFIDIQHQSYAQAAALINGMGVNILVDLVGSMKGERSAIAALRPAPVQVRWLGMAGTSGASFFDYLITDQTVTPQNQARYYSEKFVYMPYCYQINDHRPPMSGENFRRADCGLPEEAFVYCCFNTSYKIDVALFSSWMQILRRSPGSVLWLMSQSDRQKANLESMAADQGIDSHRLIFASKIPKPSHLRRLALADLGLDTHRVNGAASTSDALWAGLPVVTLQGRHFASRMASSILKAVDLSELITCNREDYENLAVRMAADRSLLLEARKRLASNIDTAPLFNTQGFVRALELAYACMWERHVRGASPEIIWVPTLKGHACALNQGVEH